MPDTPSAEFLQYAAPILCAIVAGGLIGLEREWKGQAAGFRTHILICLASALLVRAGGSMADWSFDLPAGTQMLSDPSRMAQGVLTGVGLLCAGAIFREGFTIHGLTTAASLWITCAIGILFGAGLYGLGAAGAGVTVVILIALQLVSNALPPRTVIDVQVQWRRDVPPSDAAVEAALAGPRGRLTSTGHELLEGGDVVRRRFTLRVTGEEWRHDVADRLCAIPQLTGFRLDPRDA